MNCNDQLTRDTPAGLYVRKVSVDCTCKDESVDITKIESMPLPVEALTGTWTCDDRGDSASMMLNEDGTAKVTDPADTNWIPIFEEGTWSVAGNTLSFSFADVDTRYIETATVALIDDTLHLEVLVRNDPLSDPVLWDRTFLGTEITRRQSLSGTHESIDRWEYALETQAEHAVSTERSVKTSTVDGETTEYLTEESLGGIALVDWTDTTMQI